MLTLTRRQARCLRGVFRRHALGVAGRGQAPPLVLTAAGRQLRAQHRYGGLAVEYVLNCDVTTTGVVAVPLAAPADFEGRDESTVTFEPVAPDRTLVRWSDRGVPQAREYPVPVIGSPAAFPDPPDSWSDCPTGLLDALAEAAATGADGGTRYALDCLQLKGASGEVVATDGRQLLVSGGFAFPWEGDVLVRRSPVFACKGLSRVGPVSVGKTDAHVVLRARPWTLCLEVQTGARFPRVDQAVPDAGAAATRLRLDEGDAAFLIQTLDRLPGVEGPNSPATLDLNGLVAARARGSGQDGVTELVLSRSAYAGPPVRLSTDRRLLARALRLGFRGVEVVDADSPLVCRDGARLFAWQPLSKESAVAPTDDVTRIESSTYTPAPSPRPRVETQKARPKVSERAGPNGATTKGDGVTVGRPDAEVTAPAGLASLILEAEALHASLSDARTRVGRLVVALRRQRRRERLVQSTLASLRRLKLQDVAG